jgi:hypothetical protein
MDIDGWLRQPSMSIHSTLDHKLQYYLAVRIHFGRNSKDMSNYIDCFLHIIQSKDLVSFSTFPKDSTSAKKS